MGPFALQQASLGLVKKEDDSVFKLTVNVSTFQRSQENLTSASDVFWGFEILEVAVRYTKRKSSTFSY